MIVAIVRVMRLPLLSWSLVPVLLGTSLAYYETGLWDWRLSLWTLLGVVCMQIGANLANDFFDHRSGTDRYNREYISPFTGGSRVLPNGLLRPWLVHALAWVFMIAGAGVGFHIARSTGPLTYAFFGLALVLGYLYSAPVVNLSGRGLGELAGGIVFGILTVTGTYFIQVGTVSWSALLLALPMAFLSMGMLLMNEFPDWNADRRANRRTLAVRYGCDGCVPLFAFLMTTWTLPLLVAVATRRVPILSLVALAPIVGSFMALGRVRRFYNSPGMLGPACSVTAAVHCGVGVLLSLSLLVAALF